MLNSFKIFFQFFFPRLWFTRLIGWCASRRGGWLTQLAINLFIQYYKIDIKEAKQSNIISYSTFNDFFLRQPREGLRPLNTNPNILVMPVDGIVNQFGNILEEKIMQIKNHQYSLESLLAGNCLMVDHFRNGTFINIYLSPRDYHRVYMPCNGTLREMIYVPGDLFSINRLTLKKIPNLFARNERVICLFDTEFGPMAQILVGALIVGIIETVWAGVLSPPREGIIKRWTWPIDKCQNSISLLKGEEMGRFKLGSTVINLFAKDRVKLIKTLECLSITRIGQPMAVSNETSVSKNEIDIPSSAIKENK